MALEYASPNIVLGAGRFFIDRYEDNGGVRGIEQYIGDTVGATISATVERQQIFSGDGAVATKLIDKVTQVDRSMGITPQDATLDNMALFLIAAKPKAMAEKNNAAIDATAFQVPSDATDRTYFQLGRTSGDPAGPAFFADAAAGTAWTLGLKFGNDANAAASGTALGSGDFEVDSETGMMRFTNAGIAKVKGKFVKPTFTGAKLSAFNRVSADDNTKQVRVAVRYIEDADEGVDARNIYIPQASVAPAGEAALKSRDTPQQFPLTLGIEQPDGDLAQVYVDGVGF